MKAFFDNTGESVFQFMLRYGYIKRGIIKKKIDACLMIDSW